MTIITLTSSEEEDFEQGFDEEVPATYRSTRNSNKRMSLLQNCVEELRINKLRMKQIKQILFLKKPESGPCYEIFQE